MSLWEWGALLWIYVLGVSGSCLGLQGFPFSLRILCDLGHAVVFYLML